MTVIVLVTGPDDICAPLLNDDGPHCHAASVMRRDAHAAEALAAIFTQSVHVGQRLRLSEATVARMREAFSGGSIRRACTGCSWAPLCTAVAAADYAGARIGAIPMRLAPNEA